MHEHIKPVVETIQKQFQIQVSEFRGDVTLLINAQDNTAIASKLRDDHGFDMLSTLTAVDYCPQINPRFHLVYIFYSTENKVYLTLRAPVNGENPLILTMEPVFPSANWREREVWDLFGIKFEGHSDLRRLLMPPNWEGHPLRKDYPLGYEEVQFTFNYEQIDVRKPKGVM